MAKSQDYQSKQKMQSVERENRKHKSNIYMLEHKVSQQQAVMVEKQKVAECDAIAAQNKLDEVIEVLIQDRMTHEKLQTEFTAVKCQLTSSEAKVTQRDAEIFKLTGDKSKLDLENFEIIEGLTDQLTNAQQTVAIRDDTIVDRDAKVSNLEYANSQLKVNGDKAESIIISVLGQLAKVQQKLADRDAEVLCLSGVNLHY